MNKILISILFLLCTLINACGGGGGGGTGSNEPPPPTQPTAITVLLSTSGTLPSGSVIKDIYAVITLPSTVTVKTINGVPDVVVPAGTELKFPPTVNGSDLTVYVSSTDANGIPPNISYATVNCTYTGSTTPQFTQPSNSLVAGGPPESFTDFVDLGMSVLLTVQ